MSAQTLVARVVLATSRLLPSQSRSLAVPVAAAIRCQRPTSIAPRPLRHRTGRHEVGMIQGFRQRAGKIDGPGRLPIMVGDAESSSVRP